MSGTLPFQIRPAVPTLPQAVLGGIVRRWVLLLLVLQAVAFAFLFAGVHGWVVRLDHPVSPDFVSFYAAGLLADQGQAAAAYDRAAHFAAEQAVLAPGIGYQFFLYPPPFLLVCSVLARLPWALSLAVFEAVTLLGCLLVLRAILALPWRRCLAGLLAFPALPWVLLLGQNSFMTAGLFGLALLLVDRRPVLAGLLVAGLSCKPHFAVLVPLAFAAGGCWRAFAAAAAGVLAICALATLLYGVQIWPAYLATMAASRPDLQAGAVGRFSAMVSPYGALRALGLPHAAALAGQGAGLASAAAVVALLWRRRAPLPLRAAALLAAGLVAAPMALFYDLMLALVALCWLVRQGRDTGFPPWPVGIMAACWLLPGAALFLGERHLPVGGLVAPALLLLCWRWHARLEADRGEGSAA
ncbi:MAG: glycosyltransferase family 87 protein [Janthinobacterium lividum]